MKTKKRVAGLSMATHHTLLSSAFIVQLQICALGYATANVHPLRTETAHWDWSSYAETMRTPHIVQLVPLGTLCLLLSLNIILCIQSNICCLHHHSVSQRKWMNEYTFCGAWSHTIHLSSVAVKLWMEMRCWSINKSLYDTYFIYKGLMWSSL